MGEADRRRRYLYVFSGIVYPQRAMIKIEEPIIGKINHVEAGIAGDVKISISHNHITASVETKKAIEDLWTARNIVTSLVSTITDSGGLSSAISYDVDIISVFCGDGAKTVAFGSNFPGIVEYSDRYHEINIRPIVDVATKNPWFQRALADFRCAIRFPADTGFFCRRAVESLCQYVKDRDHISDTKIAVNILCSSLNIDEGCFSFLKGISDRVRHGHIEWISGDTRRKAIFITREILIRFAQERRGETGGVCDASKLFAK